VLNAHEGSENEIRPQTVGFLSSGFVGLFLEYRDLSGESGCADWRQYLKCQ
jgi:hypothetical protein